MSDNQAAHSAKTNEQIEAELLNAVQVSSLELRNSSDGAADAARERFTAALYRLSRFVLDGENSA